MPKLNPYLENKKPIELVQELKDEYKTPSYEEFLKNYKPTEEAEILTEAEYQDRLLNGPGYGPGNEQSSGGFDFFPSFSGSSGSRSSIYGPGGHEIAR